MDKPISTTSSHDNQTSTHTHACETSMEAALRRAYCYQILQQVKQGFHTLADLEDMARNHEALMARETLSASQSDPYYYGLLDAIVQLEQENSRGA